MNFIVKDIIILKKFCCYGKLWWLIVDVYVIGLIIEELVY